MSLAGTFASRLLLEQLERGTSVLREIVELGALAAQGGDLEPTCWRRSPSRVLATVGAADCDVYALDGDTLRCLASVDDRGSTARRSARSSGSPTTPSSSWRSGLVSRWSSRASTTPE